MKRPSTVKDEKTSFHGIFNAFDHNKRTRDNKEDEGETENNRGEMMPPSRKVKEKLNIKDLNLGEVGWLNLL